MGIYARYAKRPLDFAFALVAMVVMMVPMVVVAVLVKTTSAGPILRSHTRIGRNGKEFTLHKFRSMYMNAPMVASAKLDASFITPVGKFIRKTSLDELPQLFNVLKGDMAIIGYRPVIPQEVWLNKARLRHGVLATRPGITGLAQVNGRDSVSWRDKVAFDKQYADSITVLADGKILLKSLTVIIIREPQIVGQERTRREGRRGYERAQKW